jgi:UDP-GlcNAc:undecaprenyl-phosphate GlcNAc-1-phosphate transferase
MNFFDGVSGLVSGSTFLACAVFLLLSLRATNVIDQTMVAFLSVILGMSSLAFFLFDIPPAKILMGDTGSVLCGFLIAVLAIISGGKIATAFLVVGIPLLDAVFTLIRRVVKGQAPWKGDLQHLHHRLLSAGFSPRAVVWILLLCGAVFGGIALFLGSQQKAIALGLLAFFMMVLLVGLLLLKKDPS